MRQIKKSCGRLGALALLLGAVLLAGTAVQAATTPLPRTGAALCYDSAGNAIDCVGTGQDGDILAGVPWPSPRFRDNGDGTVSDLLSGLNWTKDANAPGPSACAPGVTKNWQNALSYAKCLNENAYLGRSDWRLPNVNELRSLFHGGEGTLATWLGNNGFVGVYPGRYKSSTAGYGNLATTPWTVSLDDGVVLGQFHLQLDHVWPVRDGGATAEAALPRTGSRQCYDFGTSTLTPQCAGTGQDGETLAGVAWPEPRFVTTQETVVDNLTGLQWLRDAGNQQLAGCSGGLQSWQGALNFTDCLNRNLYLNRDDWRMPNLNELVGLTSNAGADVYDYLTGTSPGFILDGNLNLPYWSSTSYARDAGKAWSVWIGMYATPSSALKGEARYVLPVRDNRSSTKPPVSSATPPGGVYTSSQSVALSSNAPGATIYFSTDGTVPTASSNVYAARIAVTASMTINFFAVDTEGNVEQVQSASYTINDFTPPVTSATPSGGTFTGPQSVALTCSDAGSGCAAIYYSRDGTTPTVASSVYTAPIAIANTATLKFFSRDAAGNNEPVRSLLFTINDRTAPDTTASVPTGTYASAQTVTLSCWDAVSGCDRTFYSFTGTPTTSSEVYTEPLVIRASATLRFFSRDLDGNLEPPKVRTYTIIDAEAPVTVSSLAAGTYVTPQSVTLSCSDTGSGCGKTYYTTNGSTPAVTSPEYLAPISVGKSTTIKFFSKDLAGNSEQVKSVAYIINPAAFKRGDVNKSGGIEIGDALLIFQAYLSGAVLAGDRALLSDVAPLASNGTPVGDGVIDLGDVVTIMRRIVGAVNW